VHEDRAVYGEQVALAVAACLLIFLTWQDASGINRSEPQRASEAGAKEAKDMAQSVIAEVILRKADGSSVMDAREAITAGNIAKYRVSEEVAEEASRKLRDSGFEILQVGPTSLTISGDKGLFEDRFGTALEITSTNVMPSDIEGAEITYYEAKEPMRIPVDLSPRIADIVLPTPPQLFP
jgi:hypothetical protein